MRPIFLGACAVLAAGTLAVGAVATSAPTITIHSKKVGNSTFDLSKVSSLTFDGNALSVRKNVRNAYGFQYLGSSAGVASFQVTGRPGSQASLQLMDLNGRIVFSGSSRLDATGRATLQVSAVQGGMLLGRYRNESFEKTTPVPMVNGGSR